MLYWFASTQRADVVCGPGAPAQLHAGAACSGDTGCEEDYLIADSIINMYVYYIYYRPVQ